MQEPVLIKNFPNRGFAEQAKEILMKHDISCMLKSADIGILGTASSGAVQGVNLYVREEFRLKAFELLNAYFDGI